MRVVFAAGSRRPRGGGEGRDKAPPSSPSRASAVARRCSVLPARVGGGCWLFRPLRTGIVQLAVANRTTVISPQPTGAHRAAPDCSLPPSDSKRWHPITPRSSSPPGSRAPAGTAKASRLELLGEVRPMHGNLRPPPLLGQAPQVAVSRKPRQRLPAGGGQGRGPSGGAVLALPTAQSRGLAIPAPRVALDRRHRACFPAWTKQRGRRPMPRPSAANQGQAPAEQGSAGREIATAGGGET